MIDAVELAKELLTCARPLTIDWVAKRLRQFQADTLREAKRDTDAQILAWDKSSSIALGKVWDVLERRAEALERP